LSGDVRHALLLRVDQPADEHPRRLPLHRGRSAHRLRGAGMTPIKLTPMNRRRLAQFRANRRGMISAALFSLLFLISLFAEFIANDRPILIRYDGAFHSPIFRDYPETTFGGDLPTNAEYTDAEVQKMIAAKGWALWPIIPYSYDTRTTGEARGTLL